ncbi:MAG: ABC transporter substrate-binding protein [Candidatus Poribacteria bacterium]|nr:ABC transporter substrate-binding protein [Candidatus Poribacteria bacterium]
MNVRRIVTFAFVFAIVALVVGLSGCEKVAKIVPDAETSPMMTEGITIGVAVALTGDNAEPYGLPMQRGLELAREEINMLSDANITFVTEDAKSTVEGAEAAVQALVDQGVPAIVGIGISTHLEQAFPIAQEAGVVAFSPISSAAGLSSLGDYIFRAGLAVDILNPVGLMTTQANLKYTKVATIHDAADTYSTSSNEVIMQALAAGGVDILTQETFQTHDTDFSAQLTNIMEMAPDAVFISALATEMVQIIVQGREIGIPDSIHFIVPDLTSKEIQAAGKAAEGAITFSGWSVGSDAPGNQAFVQKYQAAYGHEPGPWAAQAYATLHILANAIMNAQSTDSAAIRDALAQTMDLPTILGNFSFDPNGEAMYDRVRERVVHVVKGGKLQPLEAVTPQMTAGPTIPIGLVVSLTGEDAEPYGLPMKRGFELAQKEINMLSDANIMFVPADDHSSEAGAIAAVQGLVDQGVPAIVGIAISDYLEDAFPIAQEAGVVAFSSVSTAAGLSSIGDYVFRAGIAVDIMNPSGVKTTHEKLGYEKVALIYDAADTYAKSSNDEIKKALEASGVKILTEETFEKGETDFSEQLTNIMSLDPQPDALFVSALSVEMVQVIIQAGELGIPDTIQLIVPDLTAIELQQVGDAAEGAIAFTAWTGLSTIPSSQAFVQHYHAEYGYEPGPWAALSYATLYILADAIADAQSIDPAAIRDALAQTMDFPTILGNFSFDPNGEAVYDATVLMVKDGALQLFE